MREGEGIAKVEHAKDPRGRRRPTAGNSSLSNHHDRPKQGCGGARPAGRRPHEITPPLLVDRGSLSRLFGDAPECCFGVLLRHSRRAAGTTSEWTIGASPGAAATDYCNRCRKRARGPVLPVLLPLVRSDNPRNRHRRDRSAKNAEATQRLGIRVSTLDDLFNARQLLRCPYPRATRPLWQR
jgi:hypothetical protein